MTGLLRIAAVLLFGAIAFVTEGPLHDRPQTGYPPQMERFAAFFLLGVLSALGFPKRRLFVAVLIVAGSIALELGQLVAPGRDAGLPDVVAKAVGGVAGVMLISALETAARLSRR